MKLYCFIFLTIFTTLDCIGQTDSAKVEEYIYNRVYKNIGAYYINYHIHSHTDRDKNGFLRKNKQSYFFDYGLPDDQYKLVMKIEKQDWIYPINNFAVYKIKLNGLNFKNQRPYGKDRLIVVSDRRIDEPPGNFYLIALNKKEQIKFISGSFFVEDISGDFKLDAKNPFSYIDYLRFKTFQYQTRNISFLKKRGKKLYFTATSSVFQSDVIISINYSHPGHLNIKILDKS